MKARKERHGGPEPRGMLVLKKAGGQEMTLTQEGILFANCCHGTKGPCLSCAQLLILSSSYLKEAKKSPDFLTMLNTVQLFIMSYLGHGKAPAFIV